MPLYLHHKGWTLAVITMAALSPLSAQNTATGANDAAFDDIEALMAEADSLLQALDESAVTETGWDFMQNMSIRVGAGASSNFLKRRLPEESFYLQAEMDAFLAWASENTQISTLFLGEVSVYDYDLEPSEETFATLQLSAVHNRGYFDFGTRLTASTGTLIYDSSLTDLSAPAGTRVEQWIPSMLTYVDWYASKNNRLRISLSGDRAEFSLADQDYWSASVGLQWERVWYSALRGVTTVELERQVYDEDVARLADSTALTDALKIDRTAIHERLIWDPATWEWLSADVYLGMAWEQEDVGVYEALRQSWIGTSLTIRNAWGQFRVRGRWTEYRYDERYVYPDRYPRDTRPSLQTLRTLSIEYRRALPWWNLTLLTRLKWNSINSRIHEDSYSERRGELLIQWEY